MGIEDGIKARRDREALNKLAGDRGQRADFAQRQKDARDLAVLIAGLEKRAGDLNGDIMVAQEKLDALIEELETDLPPVANAVLDIQGVLGGGTAGQIYVKGSEPLGGIWQTVVAPLSGGGLIENGAGFTRIRGGFTVAYSPILTMTGVTTGIGDLFESATLTWNFNGVTFSAPPIVSPGDTDDSRVWLACFSSGTNVCSVKLKSHESISGDVQFRLRAEGFT